MDGSRSTSRSRRSYPNLHNLKLAPLSSKYPVDASNPPSPSEGQVHTPSTSYIVPKSAPSTPGILSLSQSRSSSRNGRRSRARDAGYTYDGYFLNPDAGGREVGDIPKAKSTSTINPPPGVSFAEPSEKRHIRKRTAPTPLRFPLVRHHTSESNDEWLHRAGLAIAGETRDSKGQGWLVRRESSTSLVSPADDLEQQLSHDNRHMALLSGEHLDDVEYRTFTPRYSRSGSRIQSRVGSRMGSAHNSRRGSRVGSRIDLMMSAKPHSSGRPSLDLDEAMFEGGPVEPDFVDDEESDGDEEEVARLARERGFGLGSFMDRLIGWTLFSVDEDGEESDEEEEEDDDSGFRPENMTKEELKLRREVEAKRRKLEREAIIAASAVKSAQANKEADGEASDLQLPPDQEGGGWQDASWLFSVASRVIL